MQPTSRHASIGLTAVPPDPALGAIVTERLARLRREADHERLATLARQTEPGLVATGGDATLAAVVTRLIRWWAQRVRWHHWQPARTGSLEPRRALRDTGPEEHAWSR